MMYCTMLQYNVWITSYVFSRIKLSHLLEMVLSRVSPNSDSKSESSLSHGFMNHHFIGEKVVDGPFFAAGIFFNLFFPDMWS